MIPRSELSPNTRQGDTWRGNEAQLQRSKPGECLGCRIPTEHSLCETCEGWAALDAALQAARKLQGVRR
jgi:hypothetical protein